MEPTAAELLAAALKLPDSERADLAARLIDSLDPQFDNDAEEAWRKEIERRVAEMDEGRGKSIGWREARRRIFGLKDDTAAA